MLKIPKNKENKTHQVTNRLFKNTKTATPPNRHRKSMAAEKTVTGGLNREMEKGSETSFWGQAMPANIPFVVTGSTTSRGHAADIIRRGR